MANLENRVKELEGKMRSQMDGGLWVDMTNNRVRVDTGGKRGKEQVFPTVYEAARWLEKQIDHHPAATGSITVDNLCDLSPDAEALKNEIREIIPGEIKWAWDTYSADLLPGVVFAHCKTDHPADLNRWLLASVMRYFNARDF